MSEALSSGNFESDFVMNPPRWWGRVVSKESYSKNTDASITKGLNEKVGWGYRYKVRVFSWHTGKITEVRDMDLPMANVVLPVTAGSGIGGSGTTPSIEPGSIVTGFFMDGMGGQEPWIDGIIGNTNNNVPKRQGGKSPTDKPTPQLPTNLDNLSSKELNQYLRPERTPTSAEFAAASKARQAARAAGLSANEVERQVKLATIKAKQNTPTPPAEFLGYSLFNDTYSDSSKFPAFVADFSRIGTAPISTMDSVHQTTVAATVQDEDRKKEQELQSVCKADESEKKGISVVLSNLINDVERAKRLSQNAESLAIETNNLVNNAVPTITAYIKSILSGARGYIVNEVSKEVNKHIDKLFPTEVDDVKETQTKVLDDLNCFLNKLIDGLKELVKAALEALINLLINTPLCAVENFLSDLLDQLVELINGALPAILTPLSVVLQAAIQINVTVQKLASGVEPLLALFSCDPKPKCPSYDKISLGNLGLPIVNLPQGPVCPIGPQVCGSPTISFFDPGLSLVLQQALANPIVSPISSALIAFDIVDPGQYTSQPIAVVNDICGTGSGAVVEPIMVDGQIDNIAIINPGDGYLAAPDGSLGGNGQIWKEPYECYVKTANNEYFVVPFGQDPPPLNEGDELICPPEAVAPPAPTYPVKLCLDRIIVQSGGFGYDPNDEIIITPDNGSVAKPIINDNGEITEVELISGGCGYIDLPEIRTNSETGFNAQLIPVLRAVPVEQPEIEIEAGVRIINVVDCVGKIPPKTDFDIVAR